MTVATYAAERQAIADVLDGAGTIVLWPGTDVEPPGPSGDPATPASYVSAEVEYDDVEMDFGGGAVFYGRVTLAIWAERNAGDFKVRTVADSLVTLFAAGDVDGFTYLEPMLGPPRIKEDGDAEWYGRQMDVPFVRCR